LPEPAILGKPPVTHPATTKGPEPRQTIRRGHEIAEKMLDLMGGASLLPARDSFLFASRSGPYRAKLLLLSRADSCEPLIGAGKALFQADLWLPAKVPKLAGVQKLAWCPIGPGPVC
jgi:hypothetical protein